MNLGVAGTNSKTQVTRVKNPPANTGDADPIPGTGRSPGGGNGSPLSILTWKIPWTEKLGRLQCIGSLGVGHDLVT